MERSTRKIALVGIILLVVGLIAWIMQLTGGLLAGSNMTNVFLWGLMIAVFCLFGRLRRRFAVRCERDHPFGERGA